MYGMLTGMTNTATAMSVTAMDTMKKFGGMRSGLYVKTDSMTRVFPAMVKRTMRQRTTPVTTVCHSDVKRTVLFGVPLEELVREESKESMTTLLRLATSELPLVGILKSVAFISGTAIFLEQLEETISLSVRPEK
jgi:hypothetical protein